MKKNNNYYIRKGSLDSIKQIVVSESNQKAINFTKKIKYKFLLKKIILIIIYFAIIIWSETLYRDILFEKSVPLQEYLQKNEKLLIILKISKKLSIFGKDIWYIFIFGIIFLLLPMNYSFLLLQSIIYSSYGTNTLKMIYQSDRPNWKSEHLTYVCNYGYGNPSGHSFSSISVYLTLAHILITYYNLSFIKSIIIFIFFILASFLIIISRVILGAHSINQVLYGFNLGLGLYFILIHIIGYHKYSSIDFIQHIRKIYTNIIYYIIHISLLIIAIILYFNTKFLDHSELEKNVFNGIRCKIKKPFSKYKNHGFFQALSITSLIGAQLGINLLFFNLKYKNYIINYNIIEWNKSSIENNFLRLPIIIFSSFGIILYYIIPKNSSIIIIFIFKSGIPFFFGIFGIYYLGIYLCIYLKLGNIEICKVDALHEITSSDNN